jgi:hypothetical protein
MMKISTITRMSGVVAAAAAVSIAGAQATPSGISARIGMFLPTNSLASDLGHTWFSFGGDIKLSTMSASVPVAGTEAFFGISADYYSHGSDSDIPVALTYNVKQGPIAFGVGVGPEFRNAGDLTSTGVGIAEQVSFSYEISKMAMPIFLEAKYFLSSKSELSGFGLYVGMRF